jgi:hypothetical protein
MWVRARAGNTPMPDLTWGPYTSDYANSPADLSTGMPLQIDPKVSGYLLIEFNFKTSDKNKTPKLQKFDVYYACPEKIG